MEKTKSRKRKLKVLSIGLQFPIGLPFSRQTVRVFQQCPFTLFCWTLKWKSMQKYYQNAKREKRKNQPPRYVQPSKITIITFCRKKVDLSFSYGLKTLQDQLMEEPPEDSLRGSERVVRLEVISNAFCSALRDKGVPALVRAGLKVDVFGIENSHLPDGNQCITRAL